MFKWLMRLLGFYHEALIIGLVCHRVNYDDIISIKKLGVKHLRLSLYPNNDGEVSINTALANGYDLLVVTYRSLSDIIQDKIRWPEVKWQIGNENNLLEPTDGYISTGVASGTSQDWINKFSDLMPPNQILALHAYGVPLVTAVSETISRKPKSKRLWLTEIGVKNDARQLQIALENIDSKLVERVYIYALWSDSDGYTLSDEQRIVISKFISKHS